VVRGGISTTIRSLRGEGVRLGANANIVVEELDAPVSAYLFDDLFCG
jgi:hypothetical protein